MEFSRLSAPVPLGSQRKRSRRVLPQLWQAKFGGFEDGSRRNLVRLPQGLLAVAAVRGDLVLDGPRSWSGFVQVAAAPVPVGPRGDDHDRVGSVVEGWAAERPDRERKVRRLERVRRHIVQTDQLNRRGNATA